MTDFRNLTELSELPDPMDRLPEAQFQHAVIFDDRVLGVTQESGGVDYSSMRSPRETPSSS